MIIIVGIVMFNIGAVFGISISALMKAAHDEDERMQQWVERHGKEQDRRDL